MVAKVVVEPQPGGEARSSVEDVDVPATPAIPLEEAKQSLERSMSGEAGQLAEAKQTLENSIHKDMELSILLQGA